MLDTAINGGEIVTGRGRVRANVGIADGKIATLSTTQLDARRVVDASGVLVLAGAIDAHTHFRDPAWQHKEDFESGTRAAASGGVTTVLEMPMANVGTSSADRLRDRRFLLEKKALIDFGFVAGAGQESIENIAGLAEAGAVGFKSFLREPYPGRAENFSGTWITDDGAMLEVARRVAATGRPWCVHAENSRITQYLEAMGHSDPGSDAAFLAARPAFVEEEPVRKCLLYAREAGAAIHIVHVTTAVALQAVADARHHGQQATAEACIPHLIMSEDDLSAKGAEARVSPRLRSPKDVDALWRAVTSGVVANIASDHAAGTKADALWGWEGVGEPGGGVASVEHLLPLALSAAVDRAIPLERVVHALTEGPARLFGLWPRKGSLALGSDADVVLVDMKQRKTIRGDEMLSKAKHTVFEGHEIHAVPVMTLVRGQVVFEDGVVVGRAGDGAYISRD